MHEDVAQLAQHLLVLDERDWTVDSSKMRQRREGAASY
jgi:hypothetical protein